MTKEQFQDYRTWVHLLAWHTLDACELSNEERKTLGVFINHVKLEKVMSEENSLLKNTAQIINTHSALKSTDKPASKDEYTKAERMAINKGIRRLHQAKPEGSPVSRRASASV